ncbi:hypothetical protein [Flavobacterium sp.]|uniref:hypothetical protein n=1 Tax=Flavobacterium sp. TaxID=239 RepID=UPI002BCD2B79|nr:hypothetical protein [Flavobacterium sp.]HQA74790.1 hypothetical protein [Flavobacterium sp.]
MSKKTQAFLYNLICFAILFILFRFLIEQYTHLTGYFIPITAFVVGTLLAPKFQAAKCQGEEKIFIRWIFMKGVKQF